MADKSHSCDCLDCISGVGLRSLGSLIRFTFATHLDTMATKVEEEGRGIMKARENYKGHVIEAMSFELLGTAGFASQLFIEKHDGQGVTVTQFYVPAVFTSNESALQATVLAGRHKIDIGYVAQ